MNVNNRPETTQSSINDGTSFD